MVVKNTIENIRLWQGVFDAPLQYEITIVKTRYEVR